jgi:signal peptidase II
MSAASNVRSVADGCATNEPRNKRRDEPHTNVRDKLRDNSQVSAAEPGAVTGSDDSPEPDEPGNSVPVRSSRRRVVLFAAVALTALVLDVISKAIVVAQLGDRPPVRLLGGALYLLETRNPGAAFSVGTGATILLTVVALVVIAVIVRAARHMRSIGWSVALGLILGGALGNLVDRLFRSPGPGRGHVVDWISLFSSDGHIWPVFNVADSCIVCGAITAAIVALLGIDFDGSRRR